MLFSWLRYGVLNVRVFHSVQAERAHLPVVNQSHLLAGGLIKPIAISVRPGSPMRNWWKSQLGVKE
ncbi:unnamed protein product [Protopolystoma xenopodis]|uniref:Uncharacterized protein n=1 Tax=Protopolystoma xenopodis TaxID=117903 RepID=A0A3S5ABB2_9PLAT|nr:unnamed protein product [Protopolystoma xenopodis]